MYRYLIFSLCAGSLGAWIALKWGSALGLTDYVNERSSHTSPTPKGGGIGILAAFLFLAWVEHFSVAFWLSCAMISLIGLLADTTDIKPLPRLFAQFLGAFATIGYLIIPEPLKSGRLCPFLLASVFLVGTTNVFNFMDGIDGIAAITGVVGFGLLALASVLFGAEASYVLMTAGLAAACFGFLLFNLPKAKVFLGDIGSILLGFVFGVFILKLSHDLKDFVCLASFLFPFYVDEFTTIALRFRDHENLTLPHRRHFYQILANELAIPHWKISAGYGLVQLAVGLSLLMLRSFSIIIMLSVLMVTTAVAIAAIVDVRKRIP